MNTCRTCTHRIKMASGKGLAMYCDILSSTRTRNGHLRIKSNQPACHRYTLTTLTTTTKHTNQLTLFDNQ